jgi:hypothetical protein
MLRTASSLPLTGLSTLGFDPACFQAEPPAGAGTKFPKAAAEMVAEERARLHPGADSAGQ